MPKTSLSNLGRWAMYVGSNERSLEPPLRAAVALWLGGQIAPPPAMAKHRHLYRLLTARGHRAFVEAGTYKGETTAYLARRGADVVSVELHEGLYRAAVERFADVPNVRLVHGDALEAIPEVVASCLSAPLVFLDGHFSGEGTAKGGLIEPAEQMLGPLAAVSPPGTTVVIDDMRLFGSGSEGFPQLDEITGAARRAFPTSVIRPGLDSIVIEVP